MRVRACVCDDTNVTTTLTVKAYNVLADAVMDGIRKQEHSGCSPWTKTSTDDRSDTARYGSVKKKVKASNIISLSRSSKTPKIIRIIRLFCVVDVHT